MEFEITDLLEMRMNLEDVRAALTPDTINGDSDAQIAREYVWSVIDDLKRWEGEQVDPEQVATALATLDKAWKQLTDDRFEEVADAIEATRNALEKANVTTWGGTYTEYKD